ncbi:MAG: amino acid ABC transporter substrate-binding protein [Oscillospiraceae bacterium]|nr:amino acid ABC transporter substrate-binding protein [Oscillospiraceae bacterium]
MKKFRFAAVAAAAAMTMAFASCGANETPVQDTAAPAEGAQAVSGADESLNKVKESGKLILGLDATFEPMGYTNESDEIVGFDIDVAEEVCARMGVELVKQPIDWNTKEQDLAVGRIDCIWNGMSVNPSRAEEMNLSDPYMKNAMIFVVPADSAAASMSDLSGKNIAVQNGSTAQEILEASELYTSETPITVTAMATNVEALQQLELGLVDAVFLDSVVANYQITSAGKDYKVLPDGLSEEEYAIGFRKEDQALRDEVQRILCEMKADGKLGEISKNWFGSDITTVSAQ